MEERVKKLEEDSSVVIMTVGNNFEMLLVEGMKV